MRRALNDRFSYQTAERYATNYRFIARRDDVNLEAIKQELSDYVKGQLAYVQHPYTGIHGNFLITRLDFDMRNWKYDDMLGDNLQREDGTIEIKKIDQAKPERGELAVLNNLVPFIRLVRDDKDTLLNHLKAFCTERQVSFVI